MFNFFYYYLLIYNKKNNNMIKLKRFEMFQNSTYTEINIILDVSASMTKSQLRNGISQIKKICDPSIITLIQVSYDIENVDTFNSLDKISDINISYNKGGLRLQLGVDYIIDNDLNDIKTFIISDFFTDDLDYSRLNDYEKIEVK